MKSDAVEARFAYIWEYTVTKDHISEFRRIYGPGGDWVQLFSNGRGFIRTDLYRDQNNPGRFVTTDFWTSREARDRFRQDFAREFKELDQQGEALTSAEMFMGDFEICS